MDYQYEIKARAAWIKNLVDNAHAQGVVLGLSGGKDSAVVAGLCHAAGVKICGVYLPIGSNNSEDMKYIMPVVKKYGIEFVEYNNDELAPVWESLSALIDKQDTPWTPMAKANIKPRMRMTLLYALAQVRGYLVAGTGNASEAYVGYFTKWGDGAHDFNPIGDLDKDEVVAVGDALGLSEVVHREPSAGLWDGQTDEGEMGVTYSDISTVMSMGSHCLDNGSVSLKAYAKIVDMHNKTEHKRNPIPIYKEMSRGL